MTYLCIYDIPKSIQKYLHRVISSRAPRLCVSRRRVSSSAAPAATAASNSRASWAPSRQRRRRPRRHPRLDQWDPVAFGVLILSWLNSDSVLPGTGWAPLVSLLPGAGLCLGQAHIEHHGRMEGGVNNYSSLSCGFTHRIVRLGIGHVFFGFSPCFVTQVQGWLWNSKWTRQGSEEMC